MHILDIHARVTCSADNVTQIPNTSLAACGSKSYSLRVHKAPHVQTLTLQETRKSKIGESRSLEPQDASELDPEYRRSSRERNRLAATKTRTAQVIDTPNKFGAARNTQTYATKRKVSSIQPR